MEDQQLLAVIAELAQLLPTDIVHPPEEEAEEFSRGRALSHGAARLPAEALLFFVDIDVVIDRPAFRRIRLNTIIGTQAIFLNKLKFLIIFIGNFFLIFYLDLELFSLIYNFSI
jgi:hypothetical protein